MNRPTRQAPQSTAKAFCLFACASEKHNSRGAQSTRSLHAPHFVTCELGLIFKEGSVVVPAQGSKKGSFIIPYIGSDQDLRCHTTTFTVTAVTVRELAHKATLFDNHLNESTLQSPVTCCLTAVSYNGVVGRQSLENIGIHVLVLVTKYRLGAAIDRRPWSLP